MIDVVAPCPPAGKYVKSADGSYAVMLALDPENDYKSVDIVVFGGQKKDFECPHVKEIATTAMAGHTSYRMTIAWEEAGTRLHALTTASTVLKEHSA